jgi:hypothetical protein
MFLLVWIVGVQRWQWCKDRQQPKEGTIVPLALVVLSLLFGIAVDIGVLVRVFLS